MARKPTVEQKREALKGVFPTQSWADKVNEMPKDKVEQAYASLQSQKKL